MTATSQKIFLHHLLDISFLRRADLEIQNSDRIPPNVILAAEGYLHPLNRVLNHTCLSGSVVIGSPIQSV